MQTRFRVNGANVELDVEPRRLLVSVLREELGLTGTHIGCDTTNCRVHASLSETASDGTIALRLNGISDASNPATSSAWITDNAEAHAYGVYRFSLTPPSGDSYLIANVTVTNVHHTQIPFDYGDFVLIAHDGSLLCQLRRLQLGL